MSDTWPQTARSRTRGASERVGALSRRYTPPSTSSASMEQGGHDGGAGRDQRHVPPSKNPQTPSCRKTATALEERSPMGKDVGGLTAPLLQFWWTPPPLPPSTPVPPPPPTRPHTGTTSNCKPSVSSPPPPLAPPTTRLQKCTRNFMTLRGLVQMPPPSTTTHGPHAP